MAVGTKPNPTSVVQEDESVDLTDSAAEAEVSQSGHVPNPKIWTVRWDYFGFFVVMHSLALLICVPWFFSLTGFLAFFFGVVIFGQLGIPICYHRLLTHRSFQTPKWFAHVSQNITKEEIEIQTSHKGRTYTFNCANHENLLELLERSGVTIVDD